jgi:hypothetical protein
MLSPHNLQQQIMAMAVMTRVEGMKIANTERSNKGESPAYVESDFEYSAKELDTLMQDVIHD